MRSDERGSKSVGFHVTGDRWCHVTASEGGCDMGFRSGLPQPHSSIYLISLWLSILKRPSRVPGAACRAGTIAALMTGRYRPHLSLREGLEQTPFPLALHRVGSVLAVKGSLRRFAPWTAPVRSERRAAYEGKGGGGPRAGRTLYPVASDLTSSPSNRGLAPAPLGPAPARGERTS